MYVPQAFRVEDPNVVAAFMRQFEFAAVVTNSPSGLVASHVPVLVRGNGTDMRVAGHLARANGHWKLMDGRAESMLIFSGPHAYISPSWYAGAGPAVPTWNYSVVHAYGTPAVLDDWQAVRQLLEDTVTTFEAGLAEQWSTSRAGEDYITRLAQAIVAFEIPITRLDGKRKLSQNRPSDIQSAAAGLQAYGDATGQVIAEQMLEVARSLR